MSPFTTFPSRFLHALAEFFFADQRPRRKAAARSARPALEVLENRLAPALLVDLGNVDVTSVARRVTDGAYLAATSKAGTAHIRVVDVNTGSVTSQLLGTLGGATRTTKLSDNGLYLGGYSRSPGSIGFGEGTIWLTNDPGTAIGVGFVTVPEGPTFQSVVSDVSNNGIAVGDSNGSLLAFKYQIGIGIIQLSAPAQGAAAFAVTADGAVAYGASQLSIIQNGTATKWIGTTHSFLDDPNGLGSAIYDVSPLGTYLAGAVGLYLEEFEAVFDHAAVWIGNVPRPIDMALNTPVLGRALAVVEQGYVGGGALLAGVPTGFIYHPDWEYAKHVNDWLSTEFGMTMPEQMLSVTSLWSDGVELLIGLQGQSGHGYVALVTIGEPPQPPNPVLEIDGENGSKSLVIKLNELAPHITTIRITGGGTYRFEGDAGRLITLDQFDGSANADAITLASTVRNLKMTQANFGAGNDLFHMEPGAVAEVKNVHGGPGDDTLRGGTTGPVEFWGDEGNDRLFGTPFGDILDGGTGSNFIDAGGGDNLITVWSGVNFIRTGNGADQFLLHGGMNIIQDGGGTNTVQADRRSRTLFFTTRTAVVNKTGPGLLTIIRRRNAENRWLVFDFSIRVGPADLALIDVG